MDILGIGPLELAFILIIALIVLGPNDMVKAGRTLGRFMRRMVMSDTWKVLTGVSREIRNLPNRLIREAGLEEVQQQLAEVKQTNRELQEQIAEVKRAGLSIGGQLDQNVRETIEGVASSTSKPGEPTPSASESEAIPEGDPSTGLSAWTTPPTSSGEQQKGISQPETGESPRTITGGQQ